MVNTRQIGLGIMIAAVLMFVIGYTYIRSAEQTILSNAKVGPQGECVHPDGTICPYEQLSKLTVPKYAALFADILLFLFGLYLYLQRKPEEKALQKAKKAAKELGGEEAKAFDLVTQSNGMIFQNELVEKMGLSKVKVTRLLDKLEAKGLIERRRRGMTNVIILK